MNTSLKYHANPLLHTVGVCESHNISSCKFARFGHYTTEKDALSVLQNIPTSASSMSTIQKFENALHSTRGSSFGMRNEFKAYREGKTNGMFMDKVFEIQNANVSNAHEKFKSALNANIAHPKNIETLLEYGNDYVANINEFGYLCGKTLVIRATTPSRSLGIVARELSSYAGIPFTVADAEVKNIVNTYNGDVTDKIRDLFTSYSKNPQHSKDTRYVFIDIETTSLNSITGEIIEVGAVVTDAAGNFLENYSELFNTEVPNVTNRYGVPSESVHHISHDMIADKMTFREAMADSDSPVMKLLNDKNNIMCAHNSNFESSWFSYNVPGFWDTHSPYTSHNVANPDSMCGVQDTLFLSKLLMDDEHNGTLENITGFFGIDYSGAHRAWQDADMTRRAFFKMRGM